MAGRNDLAAELQRKAEHNIRTADQLVANGADFEFTQELRDNAVKWLQQAESLRSGVRSLHRRKNAKAKGADLAGETVGGIHLGAADGPAGTVE